MVRAPAVVRRPLDGAWGQLTASVRRGVRAEVALAQLDPEDPLRTRAERWGRYTKLLASEFSQTLRHADLPAEAKYGVAAAAVWAWLVRLDESVPDQRLPMSVRQRALRSRKRRQ